MVGSAGISYKGANLKKDPFNSNHDNLDFVAFLVRDYN